MNYEASYPASVFMKNSFREAALVYIILPLQGKIIHPKSLSKSCSSARHLYYKTAVLSATGPAVVQQHPAAPHVPTTEH